MDKITLNSIKKVGNKISYDFSVTEGLKQYFSGKPFEIEYPECIEIVPDSVAAVPFACNILPIIWLTNSVLELKELDQAFYDCISEVRKGYETMFPESEFKGDIQIQKVKSCDRPEQGKSAVFFSGGLDAVTTLITHIEEKPALISIWGADIRYENGEGWEKVHRAIAEYSERFNLEDVVIHSSFREFDNEGSLDRAFHSKLKDGWWHGVKHGIGLLGHAAPYAYLHRIQNVYIASSNCPADGHVRCSSNPLTDNYVRYANAQVHHDGFELNRQDKVHKVVEYVNATHKKLPLHVCWESQSGGNCCHCEKCYRTMAGIIAEDADPVEYGFEKTLDTIGDMEQMLKNGGLSEHLAKHQWIYIHNRMVENRAQLKHNKYINMVRWIIKANFNHPETLGMSLMFRIRTVLSGYSWYRTLGRILRRR